MNGSQLNTQIKAIFKGYGWVLHTAYWSIVLILYYSSVQSLSKAGLYPPNFLVYSYAVRLSCLFFLCYSFLLFLIPLYKSANQFYFWLTLIGLVIFWDLAHISLVALIAHNFPSIHRQPDGTFYGIMKNQGFMFACFFAFFIAFYYFQDIFIRQRELQMLIKFKTEKIALESSFLKSQINPHFLFNTLNNIYALSLKKSKQTPVIIERLESLLHYMLYECKADLVPLADEFTFTNSYIDLEKLRHREEQCVVTVAIKGEVGNQHIAPLLLINFLENAFKHGTKTTYGNSWIDMKVTVYQQSLHFELQNSKPLLTSVLQPNIEYNGGIGLKNVRRRLEILYPGKHKLVITDQKDRFGVDLRVNF
ncbi:sensor histidine kinase [Pedobacter sp. L105]|uniref:sensor histidine kinase n=1 Tax=Pedobacter sp. L105 TaxID=1641871 RepID=UPI00131B8EB6|nr:histidine kinase [Pedobacter sp. L105]